MMPTRQGSFRLFQLFGINVYLHWSWFLIAILLFQYHGLKYGSYVWYALEYLALFSIVLLHEFGHALACRQVGGQANQIVLWPLGGVAYVSPPQRPGAVLWSIAAGPLVNVVLFPVLSLLWLLGESAGLAQTMPSVYLFLTNIWSINVGLLIFNLLPIYPLDGGQILQSLLWFIFGRARSLMIVTVLGFVGMAACIPLLVLAGNPWLYVLAAFILLNCWTGLMRARALLRLANAPRRAGFACPACKAAPPVGPFWGCGKCRKSFDTFETGAVCPHCGAQFNATSCPECGSLLPLSDWVDSASVPPKVI
jgi:Zn-dependent protease